MWSMERFESRIRRVIRMQLSMRESRSSPNKSRSRAPGSGPPVCVCRRGRVGLCGTSGPKCNLNDFFRFSQREDGACAACAARRVRGIRARVRGGRDSSSSSFLTTGSSELIPLSLSVVAGVGSLVVFSEEQIDWAELSESD